MAAERRLRLPTRAGRRPGAGVAVALLAVVAGGCSAAPRTVNPGIRDRAHSLEQASHETSLRGDLERAAILEERAVEGYRSIDDVEGVAAGLNRLGNLRQLQGDRTAARKAYGEAADLAASVGATAEEAAAQNNLGTLEEESGDTAGARRRYDDARTLAESAGAKQVEAAALNNLGLLSMREGDLLAAGERFEEALVLDREAEDRGGEATRLRNLGSLQQRRGDTAQALELLEEAHRLDRERQDVPAIALDLVLLSEARAAGGGDLAQAVGERDRARAVHRFLGAREEQAEDARRIASWCVRVPPPRPLECERASVVDGGGSPVE